MTDQEFKNLERGDIVRHAEGISSYVVTDNYNGRVTAVDSADITNPEEWILMKEIKNDTI